MVIRVIVVFALLFALSSCLKRTSENVSVEPVSSEETTASSVSSDEGAAEYQAQSSQETEAASAQVASTLSSFEKPSVKEIQGALKNANLYEGNIDGILGPKTRNAIEAFQSQNNLTPDGKVGPKTWDKLKEFLAKKAE